MNRLFRKLGWMAQHRRKEAELRDELQLGGPDTVSNMKPLDKSVNRSIGAQINNQIKKKNLPAGAKVCGVDICKQ